LTAVAIERMTAEGTFSIPEAYVRPSNLKVTVNIELRFHGSTALEKERSFNIGGFPPQ
jgi:hypothetical protein